MAFLLTMLLLCFAEYEVVRAVGALRRRRETLDAMARYAQAKLSTGYNREAVGLDGILEIVREELGLRELRVEGRGRGGVELIPAVAEAGARGAAPAPGSPRSGATIRVFYAGNGPISRRRQMSIEATLRRVFGGGIAA